MMKLTTINKILMINNSLSGNDVKWINYLLLLNALITNNNGSVVFVQ